MNKKRKYPWSTVSSISTFLLGIILSWSLGSGWLDLGSISVFLAGLIGIALAVLAFAALNINYNSHHKEN